MSSKLSGAALALLISASLVVGGCAKVGEDPPPQDGYGIAGTACLTKASRVMSEFVKGEARTDEVAQAWECFGGAFRAFEKYVRGQSRDSYTPDEISKYFAENFMAREPGQPAPSIPAGLQTEFMKVKQVFVGGDRARITRGEILRIVDVASRLGRITQNLNPYMKIFVLKWQPSGERNQADIDSFDAGDLALRAAAVDLAGLIQRDHDAYRLTDFAAFVREIASFIEADPSVADAVKRFLPVARKVKLALAGGSEDQILPDEWRRIMLLGGRGYVQYLRYHYFIAKEIARGQPDDGFPLEYVARTVEDTFSIFEDLVREKPSGIVTRKEVTDIFDALGTAWPVFKYSDDMVTEIMKLKRTLIGGTVAEFAVRDFENARLKVSNLRTIIERILPFADVYLGGWKTDEIDHGDALGRFDRAAAALVTSARELGGLVESQYDLTDLEKLLKEIERLYPPENDEDSVAKPVAKYRPLVVEAKNLMFEDTGSVIKKDQWVGFAGFAGRLFESYRFYGYFVEGKSSRAKETYEAMLDLSRRAFGVVSDVIDQRGHDLTHAEIRRLAIELQKIEMIPRSLSPKTLDEVLKAILNRVMNPPGRRLAGDLPNGLRKASLDYVSAELRGWAETQMFLLDIFEGSETKELTPSQVRKAIREKIADAATSSDLKEALTGLNSSLGGSLPFVLDPDGKLLISRRLDPDYNLHSVERHNLIRQATRLFIASYAGSASRVRRSLTSSEAERAFDELKQAAIDFDVLAPGNEKFMTNRFLEANLFMPRSDGDQIASYAEIHELMFAISSGLKIDSGLRPSLLKQCPPRHSRRGKRATTQRVRYDCLYANYANGFRSHMKSMPDFLRFQRGSDAEAFSLFFYNALKGTGYVPSTGNDVALSDVSLLPQLIQYIELLYARFDANRDGAINVAEAQRAFPAFKGIFKLLAKAELESGKITEDDLPGLFSWVLKHGKPPTTLLEQMNFKFIWLKNPDSWEHNADRGQIAKILGYIADELAKTK